MTALRESTGFAKNGGQVSLEPTKEGRLRPLREQVAKALYDAAPMTATPWDRLPDERQSGWYSDADLALAIVLRAASWVADARDPEKPANYLFRREHIGSNIRSLRNGGAFRAEKKCWLGDPTCDGNCGNYGCGN